MDQGLICSGNIVRNAKHMKLTKSSKESFYAYIYQQYQCIFIIYIYYVLGMHYLGRILVTIMSSCCICDQIVVIIVIQT